MKKEKRKNHLQKSWRVVELWLGTVINVESIVWMSHVSSMMSTSLAFWVHIMSRRGQKGIGLASVSFLGEKHTEREEVPQKCNGKPKPRRTNVRRAFFWVVGEQLRPETELNLGFVCRFITRATVVDPNATSCSSQQKKFRESKVQQSSRSPPNQKHTRLRV